MRADAGELDRFALLLSMQPDRVERQTKEAIVDYAEKIAQTQRDEAPVGSTTDTRDTISAEVDSKGWGATIGTETWYAHFVEGGTDKIAPAPFIIPGLDRHEPGFLRRLDEVMDLP